MSRMTQGVKHRGERTDRDYGTQQDGSGAKRLPASDIKARSGENSGSDGEGLLHGCGILGIPGTGRVGGGWAALAAITSVDGLPKEGVS